MNGESRPPEVSPAAVLHDGSRLEDPDAFYAVLAGALDGVGEDEAMGLLCRLVLVLANEIGSQTVLLAAIERAQRAGADHSR